MNYTNDPGDVNDNREASFQKELKTEEEGGGGGGG